MAVWLVLDKRDSTQYSTNKSVSSLRRFDMKHDVFGTDKCDSLESVWSRPRAHLGYCRTMPAVCCPSGLVGKQDLGRSMRCAAIQGRSRKQHRAMMRLCCISSVGGYFF